MLDLATFHIIGHIGVVFDQQLGQLFAISMGIFSPGEGVSLPLLLFILFS